MLLKEFLNKNIGNDIEPYKLVNHIQPMNKWYQDMLTRDGQASFANWTKRRPIANEPHGYITLKSFFNPEYEGGFYDDQPEYWVNNLKKLIKEHANWEIDEDNLVHDNTYNNQGNIEDYIDYQIFTIVNPNTSEYKSLDLLLMRCSVSLDPRDYYTDYCLAVFDNSQDTNDKHYKANSFLDRQFIVMDGSLTIYDKSTKDYKYYDATATATANNGNMLLALYNEDSEDVSELDISACDDLTDLLTEIADYLDADPKQDKMSLHDIKYLSEPQE